jgi:uncharacterized membrane protein
MKPSTFWKLFAFAALLRFALIWQAEMWYDESFSYLLSTLPIDRMIQAIIGDVHPPLYYLLIWPLGQIPNLAPWMIRLPSAIFSLCSLWIFWRVLETLHIRERVQIIALSLMTILPMQLLYAQEARMYALLEMEFLLAIYAVLNRRWVVMALATVALLYTQNYGLFYAPVVWTAGMIRAPRDWKRLTVSMAVAGLTWLPWSSVMFQQMQLIGGNYWIFSKGIGAVLYTLYELFWAFSFSPFEMLVVPIILGTLAWLMVGIIYVFAEIRKDILFERAFNIEWFEDVFHRHHIIALLLAFGPLLLAVIVGLIWNPILLFRPLIGTSPFLILICAWPLAALSTTRSRLAALIFIAPMLIIGFGSFYLNNNFQKEGAGVHTSLEYVVDHWQEGDILYHAGDTSVVNWLPYSPQLTHVMRPDCEVRPYGALSDQTREAFGINIAPLEQVTYRRAWVVWSWNPLSPGCEYDYMSQLTARAGPPALVIEDNKFIYAAIWLLEK